MDESRRGNSEMFFVFEVKSVGSKVNDGMIMVNGVSNKGQTSCGFRQMRGENIWKCSLAVPLKLVPKRER